MTTLNLTIRGLCGLVPNEFIPLQPPTQPFFEIRRMRVLVLDAAPLAAPHNLPICAHHPRLTIGSGSNAQVIDLNGHKIEITGLASAQRVHLFPEFWDTAQINQVTPAPFQVADGFLTHPPGLAGVVASLRLSTGDVIGFDPLPQEQVFANGYRKNFAQAVHLKLPLSGPGQIRLTPFSSTAPTLPPIDLVPDSGDSIDVRLSNLCDPSPSALPNAEDEEGGDFAIFYSLLHEYRGEFLTPKRASQSSQRSPGEIRGEASGAHSGCIPCLYSDHPNA